MLKRILILCLITIGLVGLQRPHQTESAGQPWDVWLYENQIGRVTIVDTFGTQVNQFMLPSEPDSIYSYNMAVSRDGQFAAYTTSRMVGTNYETDVHVYNALTGSDFVFPLPNNSITSFELFAPQEIF